MSAAEKPRVVHFGSAARGAARARVLLAAADWLRANQWSTVDERREAESIARALTRILAPEIIEVPSAAITARRTRRRTTT